MVTTYYPFASQQFYLGSSCGSTDTTLLLSSFTEPVSGTPYTMTYLNTNIVYATIAPQTTSSELISFTGITQNADGTATLTGVTRGLQKAYPFTGSSTFQLPHAGQSIFIISDAPQVFQEYANTNAPSTINAVWTFNATPIGLNPGGSPDASTSTKGIAKISVAPVSSTSPIAVGQNDPQFVNYFTDTGSANTYVLTPSPSIGAYAAGQRFSFVAATANTTTSTLNVNGLGAKTINKFYNTALVANDIVLGQMVFVEYDGTNFQMISNPGNIPNAQLNIGTGANQVVALNGSSQLPAVSGALLTNLAGTSYKCGVGTKDATDANGAQTFAHGLGKTPLNCRLTAYGAARSNVVVGSGQVTVGAVQAFTTYNGTTQSSCSTLGGGAATATFRLTSIDVTASSGMTGVVTFDSSNITVTWTQLGAGGTSNTYNIVWEANA